MWSILARLNAGLRTTPVENGLPGEFSASLFTEEVQCDACFTKQPVEIIDGGDAACANASSALEPPPSRQGCCFYCEGRRAQWFDRAKCTAAPRRKLFRCSLLAHRMPPGAPPGATYDCPAPGCDHAITEASDAALVAELDTLDDVQLSKRDLVHRKAHTGVKLGKLKLLWVDHIKRVLSLLHFILNSTSSTLVIALKAGATTKQAVALNAVFERYSCQYRFKTKPADRDPKATGNECRRMPQDLVDPRLVVRSS